MTSNHINSILSEKKIPFHAIPECLYILQKWVFGDDDEWNIHKMVACKILRSTFHTKGYTSNENILFNKYKNIFDNLSLSIYAI